ncbi:hypothetical protein XA68_18112 [Ophiocordyceps unilateralis]|uniref:ABC transporter domain-containing protein n=1 Tax=Ophiocordyceps unilateralis TaxID=268505 RepID=A0A2A9P3J3_OPHUN|nr:hypothetical protein XA68_18112 [Ophiocordyceps unilateralis]
MAGSPTQASLYEAPYKAALFEALYVAFAIVVLFFVFISFLVHYGRSRFTPDVILRKAPLRLIVVGLVSLLFAAEVVFVVLHSRRANHIEDRIVACALSALAWFAFSFRTAYLTVELVGLSFVGLLFGIPLVVAEALLRKDPAVGSNRHWVLLGIQALRLLLLLFILADSGLRVCVRKRKRKAKSDATDEAQPFLRSANGEAAADNGGRASYGSVASGSDAGSDASSCVSDWSSDSGSDADADETPKDSETGQLRKSGSWIVYVRNFTIFVPYVIPRKDYKVQACIVTCLVCMIGDRFLNILVPRQIGIVADKLVQGEAPYPELVLYLGLSLIQGDSGLELIQALAKIPIEQFSYRQITNAAFNHVMSLGMDFHSDRDSAEVMKAIEQGEALTNVVKTAFLDIMPTIIDMVVAFVFLYIKFSSSVALCMMIASVSFLGVEVVSSTWNIENRRRSTKTERREARVMHQAVQGWQTVSAFNMLSYERFRFAGAVDRHLEAKLAWMRRDAFIQALLQALVPSTFFLLAVLVIRQIRDGHASPGDFVFLISYWDYLILPIKYLSHEYRFLMSDLIDAERLLDLLLAKPEVTDKEGAPALGQVEGHVEFDHVEFAYDARRKALRDIAFSVKPGETVALVGSTGSGKSSIVKLLMRYYDVTSGSIRIDGKDVRDVTQGSLRDTLGVVPQTPLLFNATIMENLRYAKLSASDEEVFEACRAAAIHDKILAFPDGYETNVGESGVRLSGGEVQRLAIARAFLKNPPILILDEATSAVDTETEAEIQEALSRLSVKRTTLVIAHRLSTIINADLILVLQDGEIVERGTHDELLDKGGRYDALWHKQLGDSYASGSGSESGDESGEEPLIDTTD